MLEEGRCAYPEVFFVEYERFLPDGPYRNTVELEVIGVRLSEN